MSNSSTHRVKLVFRRQIAVVLTAVYMLIVLTPLAPLAMYSKVVTHAVTGECVGDCKICGCSLESQTSKTCCCWQKKQKQYSDARFSAGAGCATKTAPAPSAAKGSCSSVSHSADPVVAKNDNRAKNEQHHKHHEDSENVQAFQHNEERSQSETVYKCGCPCGKGNLFTLAGAGTSELLPYIYSERIVPPHEGTHHYSDLSQLLASRHGEPPDPPPRLQLLS
jgi:hypothetical protein